MLKILMTIPATKITKINPKKHQTITTIRTKLIQSVVLVTVIGKKHALKKYDQFTLNTSCFWGSTGSNITPVVKFHEIFVTKIMNKLLLLKQKFREIAQLQ